MKILVLSDLHIALTTPWARSGNYEDMTYLRHVLKSYKASGRIPDFDMCILCGDIFNSPKLSQGDYPVFAEILDILGVLDKPILAINGNHDPGGHHVCENLKGFHRLDVESFMGIAGHSYSQNIEEIKEWLKRTNAQITVTHQSCSLFMNLGNLQLPQLRGEDFHASLNFIGDTHVSHAVEVAGKYMCVSPGILCPMRSRAELFDSDPHLTVVEMDYLGDGKWDVDNADLSFIQLPKRPAILITPEFSERDLRKLDFQGCSSKCPVIAYLPTGLECSTDFTKYVHTRVIPFSDVEKELDVDIDYSVIVEGAKTVDTVLQTADQLLADDTDKQEILALVKDLVESDQPADIAKHFLEDENEITQTV